MEPLVWSGSALFQVASALAIAGYFVVLALSVQRAELQAWVFAWLANLAALAITFAFRELLPNSPQFVLVSGLYFFAKTQFVVLLVAGATRFALEKPRPVPHGRFNIAIALFSTLCSLVVGTLDRVGMVQSVAIGAFLIAGAIAVSKTKAPGWQWLAIGFVLRMLFATAETVGYAAHAMGRELPPGAYASFLAMHSAFDAGAEWIIALGGALMLRRTTVSATSSNV